VRALKVLRYPENNPASGVKVVNTPRDSKEITTASPVKKRAKSNSERLQRLARVKDREVDAGLISMPVHRNIALDEEAKGKALKFIETLNKEELLIKECKIGSKIKDEDAIKNKASKYINDLELTNYRIIIYGGYLEGCCEHVFLGVVDAFLAKLEQNQDIAIP
jgi:hypothetical protein